MAVVNIYNSNSDTTCDSNRLDRKTRSRSHKWSWYLRSSCVHCLAFKNFIYQGLSYRIRGERGQSKFNFSIWQTHVSHCRPIFGAVARTCSKIFTSKIRGICHLAQNRSLTPMDSSSDDARPKTNRRAQAPRQLEQRSRIRQRGWAALDGETPFEADGRHRRPGGAGFPDTARGGPSPLGPSHQRGEAAYISWCQVAARTESSSPPVRPDPHPARGAVGPAVGPAKTPSLSESGRRNIQCAAFGRVRVAAAGMWRNSRLQSLCFDAAAQSPR